MKIEDIDREFRELARLLKEADSAFRSTRYKEAEGLYRQALELNQSSYGEEHEDTIRCLSNLGDIYYSLKNYQQAIPMYGRLLVVQERTLGPNHGDVATILFKLARTYHKLGKAADAEPLYRRALSIADTAYGSNSSITSTVAESFATLLRSTQSKTGELERLEERLKARMGDSRRITGHQTGSMLNPLTPRDPRQSGEPGSAMEQARSTYNNLVQMNAALGTDPAGNSRDALSASFPPGSMSSSIPESSIEDPLVQSGRMKPLRTGQMSTSAGRATGESVDARKRNLLLPILGVLAVIAIGGGAFFLKSQQPSSQSSEKQTAEDSTGQKTGGSFLAGVQSMFGHPTDGAQNNVAGKAPLLDPGRYVAADLKRRLEVHVTGEMNIMKDGVRLDGKYTTDGASVFFRPQAGGSTISYKILPHGLQEDDGTMLYGKNAPEATALTIMNRLASYANQYYRDTGSYPHDMEQLHIVVRNLMYQNPVNGTPMEPQRMQITGADAKAADMDMSTYTALITQVKSLSVWTPQQHQPCAVEFFRTANTSDGECFYIKGTDRNGQYFKASGPATNTAVVLSLVQGKQRSN